MYYESLDSPLPHPYSRKTVSDSQRPMGGQEDARHLPYHA